MYNTYYDQFFNSWMNEVDSIVFLSTGFHSHELPDQLYAENFESGILPYDMAMITINNYYHYLDIYMSSNNSNKANEP